LNRVPFDDEFNGVQPAGYLTLGGRPAEVEVTGKSVTLPVIHWEVGAAGAFINEQAWSAPDVKTTFTFPGSDDIVQTPVYANMDTGTIGVGLPSPAYKAYTALITSLACDGSGLPDLAWNVNGIDFPFDKRDLLGYFGGGECYLNIRDEGENMAGL
jgi:hypothetical protein